MQLVYRFFCATVGLGIFGGVLAGCQEGVRFKVSDQRVAEQVGLRIEPMGSFGREGILARQPRNLGRAYQAAGGELRFEVYRLTNISEETIELYPTAEKSREGPAAAISQYFAGACVRESYGCLVDLGAALRPTPELESEYAAEFNLIGSEFRFDGGGVDGIGADAGTPNARPIRIRPGESANWTMRLGLREGSPVIPSGPLAAGAGTGESFLPAGHSWEPASLLFRGEWLMGLKFSISVSTILLVRNPKTDELNPVYFPPVDSTFLFASPSVKEFSIAFPPPKVARRIIGLAETL